MKSYPEIFWHAYCYLFNDNGRGKMQKKFSGFLLAVLVLTILLTSACNKTDGIDSNAPTAAGLYVISSGLSNVMFFHYENLTYMNMIGKVLCQNEVGGRISAWKFVFKSGGMELLEINNANYSSYALNLFGQLSIAANDVGIVNVSYADKAHENFSPFPGKLFTADPDNMDIFMTISDNHGNVQTIELNTPVAYNFY